NHAVAQFFEVIPERHARFFEDVVRILVVDALLGLTWRSHDADPADGRHPTPRRRCSIGWRETLRWKVKISLWGRLGLLKMTGTGERGGPIRLCRPECPEWAFRRANPSPGLSADTRAGDNADTPRNGRSLPCAGILSLVSCSSPLSSPPRVA